MAGNVIQGALPMPNGGAGLFQGLGGSPQQAMAQLGPNYANAYNSALAINQANYNNILQGYQQTAGQQQSAQDKIAGGYTDAYNRLVAQNDQTQTGYGQLSQNVLGTINGIGRSQAQAIADEYTRQSGEAAQGLISRGLGNTTVQNAVQRGIDLDQSKAQTALANQVAQLTAGYQSSLGLAGLNFRNQAAMQQAAQQNLGLGYQAQAQAANTALAGRQLDWMNSVNAPYPQVGAYSQLAQQFGAAQQGAADRSQAQDALKMQLAAGRQGGQPVGGGYGYGGGGGFFGQPSPDVGGGAPMVVPGAGGFGGYGGYQAPAAPVSRPGDQGWFQPPVQEQQSDVPGPYDDFEAMPYGALGGGQLMAAQMTQPGQLSGYQSLGGSMYLDPEGYAAMSEE